MPRFRLRAFAVGSLALSGVCLARDARAEDDWVGTDKALHFGTSAVISGGTYAFARAERAPRWLSFVAGGAAGISVGLLKEGYDATGHGDPSWKDLTWDILGTTAGLVLVWGQDVFFDDGSRAAAGSRDRLSSRHGLAITF